ncbi:Rossmann-like and DUF2520 domain-containing protein [Yeosuana sp. MJ-SS3]|uniref:Rossmann-like and DUF2520 domain-containing protein n=1 Tax=Gilvirhabdus luticola TaxID=3079858 RepID=A0ABU3U9V6_9FLAO|nr:Rossmann-like and DUF2520 domain-containing protein [Yeosuana sp. MJ-SS3]MDU8887191.1 Rossmann-like and DUF2520 domain-containing protein [Yeosuana sp. MJ-SS3]
MISVVILGAGNVATHLFKAFTKSDEVQVKTWYNRDIDKLKSYKNDVYITNNLALLKEADIYILAVSDDAISKLSSALPFENKFLVHTSGSVSVHTLDKKNRRGVLYPIQTLSKDAEIDFSNVPLCLETLEKTDLKTLKNLAEAIDSPYYKISTEQRLTLHLVAIFINNFTNQLYRIGHEIADAKHIDFNILKPLILETANKVQNMSPYLAQTGPAIRNDEKTIKKHLKLLENENYKEIYRLLTHSIQQTHGRKKL